jgi:hypothetical protein
MPWRKIQNHPKDILALDCFTMIAQAFDMPAALELDALACMTPGILGEFEQRILTLPLPPFPPQNRFLDLVSRRPHDRPLSRLEQCSFGEHANCLADYGALIFIKLREFRKPPQNGSRRYPEHPCRLCLIATGAKQYILDLGNGDLPAVLHLSPPVRNNIC